MYRDLADTKEEEKQAARLETAATNKAYDIKQQQYDRSVYESDRNYELDVAKYQSDLAKVATGQIDDLIPTFTTIAKDSASRKGTGGYEGEVTYTDPRDGKQKKITVKGVNFNPANKSAAQRDAFWKKYVEDKTGTTISGNVIRNVERGSTKRPPREIAKIMFDSAGALGQYSSAEIFQAIMRTPFGMMNAAAVREAYQGL
jgi:putative cofactor-binding repeat protein